MLIDYYLLYMNVVRKYRCLHSTHLTGPAWVVVTSSISAKLETLRNNKEQTVYTKRKYYFIFDCFA